MLAAWYGMLPSVGATPAMRRCTLVPGFHAGSGTMLAVPTPDTLLAGVGSLRMGSGYGHSGSGRRAAIYGQRFQANRLHSAEGGVGDSVQDVVLVPWDYDAGCEPVPWARSARWRAGADTLLYAAQLRKRSEWVGDLPTFDVTYPETAVYDGRPQPDLFEAPDTTSTWNTPSEYFELLRRSPTAARLLAEEAGALDELVTWAAANPTAMAKRPAKNFVEGHRRAIRRNRLLRSEVTVRGTYKLTIRLRSGREFIRYLQTADAPTEVSDIGEAVDGPNGFDLDFTLAAVPGALPPEIALPIRNWGLEIVSSGSPAQREFQFRMELPEFAYQAEHIPEVAALIQEWTKHRSPHWSEGDYPESPGRIVLGRNGSARLRISWDTDEDGREDVVVEGERISMATTKKWFWWRDR